MFYVSDSPHFLYKTCQFEKLKAVIGRIASINGVKLASEELEWLEDNLEAENRENNGDQSTIGTSTLDKSKGPKKRPEPISDYLAKIFTMITSMYGCGFIFEGASSNLEELGFNIPQHSGILFSVVEYIGFWLSAVALQKYHYSKIKGVSTVLMSLVIFLTFFTTNPSNLWAFVANQVLLFGAIIPLNTALYTCNYQELSDVIPAHLLGQTHSIKNMVTKIGGFGTPILIELCRQNGLPMMTVTFPFFIASHLLEIVSVGKSGKTTSNITGDKKIKVKAE